MLEQKPELLQSSVFHNPIGFWNILQILIGSWKAKKATDFKIWGKKHTLLNTWDVWLWGEMASPLFAEKYQMTGTCDSWSQGCGYEPPAGFRDYLKMKYFEKKKK